MNAFERGRMVGLWEASLSYHDIAARTGHAAMTVMHEWNQWREKGLTQRQAGTGPCMWPWHGMTAILSTWPVQLCPQC